MQSVKNSGRKSASRIKLNAFSLAGLGIGSIIGSGFFLGSAISIRQAGPSVVIAFLLCGFLFSQVLGAITSVSVNRPVTGCFKVYAEQFFEKYFGFSPAGASFAPIFSPSDRKPWPRESSFATGSRRLRFANGCRSERNHELQQ